MMLHIGQPEYGGAFRSSPDAGLIRFVLPGELIETTPFAILEPSPDRVAPGCRHFGVCGGCDYQHATYQTQLQIKETVLHGLLGRAGLDQIPAVQTLSSHPWRYRSRVRMRVEAVDGSLRVGYNRRGTREFLPVAECPIASPLLWRAAEALTALATGNDLAARWIGSMAEVEFHTTTHEDALQMTVFTRDRRVEDFAAFCTALAAVLPELTGAGVLALTAGYGAKERAQWGAAGLTHVHLGRNFWATRGGFFQVNRFLTRELIRLVTDGRAGMLAWDLYAGVGLFSRVLVDRFASVVAVESNLTAAADLMNAPRHANKLQAVRSETAAFLRGALLQRDRPDLIVMDPPRAGVGAEVCRLLARIAAPRVIYVSCDPETLARDLRMLVDSGYRIAELHLLDMFPQTFHLETVVFLDR